jgi:hypothetical protein
MTVDGVAIAPIYGPYGGLYYSCSIGSWAAGPHTYAIRSTDSTGFSSSSTGTFPVVAAAVTGPTISSVVIAEAIGPRDGTFKTDEKLVITWAATSPNGIASQTMTVDGVAIAPIYGPYGGLYYSCTIENWSAGTHTYTIRSTDSQGISSDKTSTFSVVAALTVDASAAPRGSADALIDAQLAPIITEAERRWETQLGATQVETAMAGVSIKVANLPAGMLGETLGKTIWIDDDAAGYGWFVDPTPGDDVEYGDVLGPHTLAARRDTAADQRVDLLTTVMHEMGHLLGYQHAADDLMQAVLPLGVRRSSSD